MGEPCLQVKNISAGYVPGLPVISAVCVSVPEGNIVTVIGPNGAGKSTLIKAVAGLLTVEQGTVSIFGQDITGVRPDRLSDVGVAYVPQTANVFRTLSIEQNLILAARRCRERANAQREHMLSLFPVLREKYKARASSLSGGQRQFLAIAMALVAQPKLLLMDEPSAGLSPKAAQEMLALLQTIAARGVGILLVEQNARAALRISDYGYVLADGRNQHESDAQSLMNDPLVAEIYLGGRRRA